MTVPSLRTRLKVGTVDLTELSTDGTQPELADVHIVDPVTIVQELPDGKLWPAQETESASFRLYAPNAGLLATVVEGAPVDITVGTPRATGATELIRFRGRVTDAVLRSHRQGCLIDVTCMDYLHADFGERVVGDVPWAQEPVLDRIGNIMGAMGLPDPVVALVTDPITDPMPLGIGAIVRARDVDAQPALGLLEKLLDAWAFDVDAELTARGYADQYLRGTLTPGTTSARALLVPFLIDAAGDVTQWALVRRLAAATPWVTSAGLVAESGMFEEGPDGWGVAVPGSGVDRSPLTIGGGYVDLSSAAYVQRRGKRPTRVSCTYWSGVSADVEETATVSNGDPQPVIHRMESDLISQVVVAPFGSLGQSAAMAARMYLPDPGGTDWYADTYRWRWYADIDAQARPLPRVGDVLTVAPVQDRHSPLDRPWYTGMLTGIVWSMTDGRPVADLTIRPELRKLLYHDPEGGLQWDQLPVGVTWDDLNPRDTWTDYRLLRSEP